MVATIKDLGLCYFIAQREPDGSPGRPVGGVEVDGAVSLFDDIVVARRVRDELALELGPLGIFAANVSVAGEIIG